MIASPIWRSKLARLEWGTLNDNGKTAVREAVSLFNRYSTFSEQRTEMARARWNGR